MQLPSHGEHAFTDRTDLSHKLSFNFLDEGMGGSSNQKKTADRIPINDALANSVHRVRRGKTAKPATLNEKKFASAITN